MAAGLGTRLRPLTDTMPKPLVPFQGRPMIEYVLDLLEKHQFDDVRLNVHYLPEKMEQFVDSWNRRSRKLKISIQEEKEKILGSGGALSKAASWMFEKDDFCLVCNADVIANPDLGLLVNEHKRLRAQGVKTTLAVMPHPEAGKKYNGLRVARDRILQFERSGAEGLFHFPGFYVIDKSCESYFLPEGIEYSVVEKIWEPLAKKGELGAWKYEGNYFDLGTVEDIRWAEQQLSKA